MALQAIVWESSQFPYRKVSEPGAYSLNSHAHYRELAENVLHTLCAAAKKQTQDDEVAWESFSPTGPLVHRDLYAGNAGVILVMAELFEELEDEDARSVLLQGTTWLQRSPPLNNQVLPGLYIGEAGVGSALLRAGQILCTLNLSQDRLRQLPAELDELPLLKILNSEGIYLAQGRKKSTPQVFRNVHTRREVSYECRSSYAKYTYESNKLPY